MLSRVLPVTTIKAESGTVRKRLTRRQYVYAAIITPTSVSSIVITSEGIYFGYMYVPSARNQVMLTLTVLF
jgi:hypothetical protein